MKYVVKQLIWHTGEQRYCQVGEAVSLGHLSDADVRRLIDAGVVAESTDLLSQVPPRRVPRGGISGANNSISTAGHE